MTKQVNKKQFKYKGCRYHGKRVRLHIAVYLEHNKIESIPKGYCIHHIDFDIYNNNPDNLIMMSVSDHISMHRRRHEECRKNAIDTKHKNMV